MSSKRSGHLTAEKTIAAAAAVEWVRDGMKLGLGTGSTAAYFIRKLAERLREQREKVKAVATSEASERLAASLGITVVAPSRGMRLDMTVDGADEIGPGLSLIKGGGGALLREKVVAAHSDVFLVIADSSKPKAALGAFPLPVEVAPFATPWVMDELERLGGNPQLRVKDEGSAVLSDQGNHLADCAFGVIAEPEALAERLEHVPGIVEHGLFLGMATEALVGEGGIVRKLEP